MSPCIWRRDFPETLVVSCSDGRVRSAVDSFVLDVLAVPVADWILIPGGPGALAGSGAEYCRSDQVRRDALFLLNVHNIRSVVLVQHGAADGGPEEASCGDYVRKMAGRSIEAIRIQQERDAAEAAALLLSTRRDLNVVAFFAETGPEGAIQFREVPIR